MAGPSQQYLDYVNSLDPYGGNTGSYYESEYNKVVERNPDLANPGNKGALRWYANQNLGITDPDEIEKFASGQPGGYGLEESVNKWAELGRGALGMQRGSAADIDAARVKTLANRGAQVDLLKMIAGARADATTSASRMSHDDLLKQAARAQARGVDPGLALAATAAAGRDVATAAAGSRVSEAAKRQAALQGGSQGVQAQDLQRAALEQQTLEGDLAFQAGKEDLYLQHIGQGMRQKAAAGGAEADMANIVAGTGGPGFSFTDNVLPGLTQMASMGLMSAFSGGSSQPSAWSKQEDAAYGNAMQGLGFGDSNAVDDYLSKYGRW